MPNIIYNLLKPLAVALTGQSHLQHHQHHQPELSAILSILSTSCSWPGGFVNAPSADLCQRVDSQRCSPTAAVDFRDDAAAAEALPDCADDCHIRKVWDERPCPAGVLKPVNQSAAQNAQIWSGRTSRSSSGSAADPQLTYITLMACAAAPATRSEQQQQRSRLLKKRSSESGARRADLRARIAQHHGRQHQGRQPPGASHQGGQHRAPAPGAPAHHGASTRRQHRGASHRAQPRAPATTHSG
uniref:Uncharacterized protein n=1 Tax=Macrostomum lignano TaxID=282301 RepID=A0A1I8FAW2_9PLAT